MKHAQIKPVEKVEGFLNHLRGLSYQGRRKVLLSSKVGGYPRFQYKYVPFDAENETSKLRLRQILIGCELRLSSPNEFNDPYDLSCFTDYSGTVLQRRKRLEQMLKELRPELTWKQRGPEVTKMLMNSDELFKNAEISAKRHASETGVCCFTTDPRNILMWSHYARNHTGLVLQFETSCDLDVLTRTVKVKYENDYPVRRWVDNDLDAIGKMLTQKFSLWSYENERRIVLPGEAGKSLKYLPRALSGVIFGCKAPESAHVEVNDMLRERTGHMPKLYKAIQHERSYSLLIARLKE